MNAGRWRQRGGAAAAITRLLERLSALTPSDPGVRLDWHDALSAGAREAYLAVGGESWVPSELLEVVLATPGPHRKRIAVLYREGAPWAVVPLRLAGRYWEPLMTGVIPQLSPFPCRTERGGVLAALRLNIACWASPEPPRGWRSVRWSEPLPSFDLDTTVDPQPYWRRNQHWRTILVARRRTASFDLVIDDPEACAWSIRGWRDRFWTGADSDVASNWNDRIAVADWALANGWRMHSWHLRDGDRWVAGVIAFADEGRLSEGTVYRDPDYDWQRAGHRTGEEMIRWGMANGMQIVSFGAWFDYKRKWAPPSSLLWNVVVAPLPVHCWNALQELVSRLRAGRRGSGGG